VNFRQSGPSNLLHEVTAPSSSPHLYTSSPKPSNTHFHRNFCCQILRYVPNIFVVFIPEIQHHNLKQSASHCPVLSRSHSINIPPEMSLSQVEIDAFDQAFMQAILRCPPLFPTPDDLSPHHSSRIITATDNGIGSPEKETVTENIPPTSINNQRVTGTEVSILIQESSPLQSLPSPVQSIPISPPPAMKQPVVHFEDLPFVDYNTFSTDNFHPEAKTMDFNYHVHNQPIPTDGNTYSSNVSHHGSQLPIQTPISPVGPVLSCDVCRTGFSSHNKLFRHIREAKHHRVQPTISGSDKTDAPTTTPEVINSNAPSAIGSHMTFHNYNYVEITARSTPDGKDSTYGMQLSDSQHSFRPPNILTYHGCELISSHHSCIAPTLSL
jgi:hypothetical protein